MLRRRRTRPPVAPQTPEPVTGARTALDVVGRSIDELLATDPADTTGVLTATWYGFGVAQAPGQLLALDNSGDALSARHTRPVFQTVTTLLLAAPSLPYHDHTIELADGLAPERCAPRCTSARPGPPPSRVPCGAGSRRWPSS